MIARRRPPLAAVALLAALHAAARAEDVPATRNAAQLVWDDLRYAGRTAYADAHAIVTAPLQREKPDPTPGIAISPQVGPDHSVGICLALRF